MKQTILLIIAVLVIGYSTWQIKRWVNYSWGYQSQVRSTVCEMVKPEYIKDNQCD